MTSRHNCHLQESVVEILRDVCLAVWVTLEFGTPPVALPQSFRSISLASHTSVAVGGAAGMSPVQAKGAMVIFLLLLLMLLEKEILPLVVAPAAAIAAPLPVQRAEM